MADHREEDGNADTLPADASHWTRSGAVRRTSGVSWNEDASRVEGSLCDGRFRVLSCLGEGGMGRVYEAYDEAYGANVALKMLRSAEPALLPILKNEFRALADLSHPNLVELYELFCDEGSWFLTMELVRGVNLEDWLAERRALSNPAELDSELRDVLGQISAAIAAIHANGKLHCDLKPSNAMVTPEGKAVVLDYGLARELRADRFGPETTGGTPAYVAPEQVQGHAPSEASDWYAFGVILYEALSGRLPFGGRAMDMLAAKIARDPPDLDRLAPEAPADLRALCKRLLDRDPSQRPSGPEILERFQAPSAARTSLRPSLSAEAPFVGREGELTELAAAFEQASTGKNVLAWVHGPSGMGKTALVNQFLASLERADRALVLRGRCYEREAIPYKACDALIERLSHRLGALDAARLAGVTPPHLSALLHVFPAFRRVDWPSSSDDPPSAKDKQELRRLAFVGFKHLLLALGKERPVVLYVDDLQWGDADSAKLLSALLAPPPPPSGCLFIGSVRSDERGSGELLPELTRDEALMSSVAVREVPVGKLTPADARKLAAYSIGDGERAASVASEADGSPFYIGELAHHLAAQPPANEAAPDVELGRMIGERLERLPTPLQTLVELVALSGHPVELDVALSAADLRSTDRRVVARLQSARMLRARRVESGEWLETYHDRIREAVVAKLEPARVQALHRALAATLEQRGAVDPERLATHYRDAGEPLRAARYAQRAGDSAYAALAFDRAAEWYRSALAWSDAQGAERRALERRLGDTLTYAGRGALAARHYLAACAGAPLEESVELERRAAEQLLISGHQREGLEALIGVLERAGVAGPHRGPPVLRLLWQRARLRARGLDFVERAPEQLDATALRRIDACSVAARSLLVREPVKGATFGSMHLRLALDAGEPTRILEGLGTEIMYSATEGSRSTRRVESLIERARRMCTDEREPAALAYFQVALAADALLNGRFQTAVERSAAAEAIYRQRCTGVTGPLNVARCIWAPAKLFLGDFAAAMAPLGRWLEDAREREDLEAEGQLGIYRLYGSLGDGDLDAVRGGLEPTLARWRPGHRETAGMTAIHVLLALRCYERADVPALLQVRELYQPFFRSLLARVQLYRVVVTGYCGSAELAVAAQQRGHARATRIGSARRFARRLAREGVPHADALAHLLEGTAAHLDGNDELARTELARASTCFEGTGQKLWAACAEYRLGQMIGGDEGEQRRESARVSLRARGIAAPDRFVAVYAPGYAD